MLTFLDLLVVVFMVLAALSLLAVSLMFLVRRPRLRKVCFYTVVGLGVYAASVGIRIGWVLFPVQVAVGVAAGALSVGALVLERTGKGDERKFLVARLLATAALAVGMINAVM